MRALWSLGVGATLGVAPLLFLAVQALAARDYVAAALLIAAAVATGQLGLSLLSLTLQSPPEDPL